MGVRECTGDWILRLKYEGVTMLLETKYAIDNNFVIKIGSIHDLNFYRVDNVSNDFIYVVKDSKVIGTLEVTCYQNCGFIENITSFI